MIVSTGLNNHDVINYHTVKFEDKKSEDDQFAKELKYQEQHIQSKDETKKYTKIMDFLNREYRQDKQDMNKRILRENTLQSIQDIKVFNKKVQAYSVYKENQEGVKVFFS